MTGCDKISPAAPTATRDLRRALARRARPSLRAGLRPAPLARPAGACRCAGASPRSIFVNSMSDLFHEDIPDEFIAAGVRGDGPRRLHTFQVLTKRHERLAELAPTSPGRRTCGWASASRTAASSHRADDLREVPAAVRFISAEPLLGPLEGSTSRGIDWLIAGGESGPRPPPRGRRVGARPPRPLRRREHRLLLQAVGRRAFEDGRPPTSRPHLGRDAHCTRTRTPRHRLNPVVPSPGGALLAWPDDGQEAPPSTPTS